MYKKYTWHQLDFKSNSVGWESTDVMEVDNGVIFKFSKQINGPHPSFGISTTHIPFETLANIFKDTKPK